MEVHLLTDERAASLPARLFPVAAGRPGPRVVVHVAHGGELPASAAPALEAWSALRVRLRRATRYNHPQGFASGLRRAAANPSSSWAIAAVFVRDGTAHALVVGRISAGPTPLALGLRTPALRRLVVEESAALSDGDPWATAALGDLLREALRSRAVEALDLESVPVGEALHAELGGPGRLSFPLVRTGKVRWCARLVDPATGARGAPPWERDARKRSQARRLERHLAEHFGGDVVVETVVAPGQVDAFVCTAAGIVSRTYQAGLGIGVADTPAFHAFLRELAEGERLRAYLLRGRGEPIAYLLGELESGRFQLIATAYLPEHGRLSPGRFLLGRVLRDLAAEQVDVIDFGWGDAQYKRHFGTERGEEEDLRVYGATLRARAAFAVDRGVTGASARARALAGRSGVLAPLRRLWRSHLRPTPEHD